MTTWRQVAGPQGEEAVWYVELNECADGLRVRFQRGSLLIGAQALSGGNLVFCALQVMNLTASIAIFGLAYRYRGMVCDVHRREMAASNPAITVGPPRSGVDQASRQEVPAERAKV